MKVKPYGLTSILSEVKKQEISRNLPANGVGLVIMPIFAIFRLVRVAFDLVKKGFISEAHLKIAAMPFNDKITDTQNELGS
ncbi:hypothetical protein OH492_20355 [Vibrio chagasii]|nr:hypothetical protein [Vibrio chagasii]